MIRVRRGLAIGMALTASLSAAACSSSSASDGKSYTIGVLVSQTGSASQLGVGELRGAQLAAESINAAGGIGGKKIVITAADDQSKPDQAVEQARNLLKDKVAAIVGPSVVGSCKAVMPLVKSRGPVNYCLSPGIKPADYTWSASANTADLAQAGLNYWKAKGITKVGLLSTTDGSGTDGAAAVSSASAKLGVQVVSRATYDPTTVSITSQLQQVTAGHPQAIVLWATGTPVGVALKAIQQAGLNLPVMTTDGNLANAFLKRIADYTPKTLLIPATRDFWWQTLPASDPAVKLEKDYHDGYQAKYNEPPDFGPGVAYDAVLNVAAALRKAGSDDAKKLRSALEQLAGAQGVVGAYTMRADDHRGLSLQDVAIVQAQNGRFTYVGK
ncbi:MAG: ABC transporter substrate-binding protein [Actinoallomurus sp.]